MIDQLTPTLPETTESVAFDLERHSCRRLSMSIEPTFWASWVMTGAVLIIVADRR